MNLTVLIHHASLQRDGYHGADGVEHIDKEKGEHHDKHVQREDVTPLELKEDGLERGRRREEPVPMGHSHRDANERRQKDSPEETSPDVPDHQQSTDDETDERQVNRRGVEVSECHLRALVGNDDAAVLQSDKGDEKTDAASDGRLHASRNGVGNQFPEFEEREEDKKDALDEDSRQRKLPAVAHPKTDGENEKGVDAHARCQPEGFLGIESHRQAPDDGGQHGGSEHCAGRHPQRLKGTKDAWIHGQNVGHGEKGCDTCIDFGTHLMVRGVKSE